MKFLQNGPDIPNELIAAQERGEVIFICGAGVSMQLGLPSFKGLIQRVYDELGEQWELHHAEREGMKDDGQLARQYDRVLRCLERRLAASNLGRTQGMRERIRAAIRAALRAPVNPDLTNHAALLDLSRDFDGNIRLLTTNFDTLFERAWPIGVAPSHAGAAMPQPKTAGCAGVLHLHGRLGDDTLNLNETDLVLTSAEFGDAYLRSGWASRYVYDLVRAFTVVLVGYQADDPPMRYLLEVLEADRERYPDLQRVYAFAASADGDSELQAALWQAKGVEPILHDVIDGDYSPLYGSLREWRRYGSDPTQWRREQLKTLLSRHPQALTKSEIAGCVHLLSHRDASQLLGEISPSADCLAVLNQQRVFDGNDASPGQWIGTRVNDLEMITACGGHPSFDDQTVWFIERALERERDVLTPVRRAAWEVLLTVNAKSAESELGMAWYRIRPRIREGLANYEARRLITSLVRPRLTVSKRLSLRASAGEETPESLHSLLWIDFKSSEQSSIDEVLEVWPRDGAKELQLLKSLERALLEALDQASDLEFLSGWDRADHDVPSVARHPQNEYRSGFYPIIRLMADVWERLAEDDVSSALRCARSWAKSPFNLIKRLALFSAGHPKFPAGEAADLIANLDDHRFWISGAQVEIMRTLLAKWDDIPELTRVAIEDRIAGGIPRSLFQEAAIDNEDDWASIHDSSVNRRLTRLRDAGKPLQESSKAALAGISLRHPKWKPGGGDRDDFHSWMESRSGPDGHPELLKGIADDGLVQEAMRLQRERHFDESDLWRVFCLSDPERALRGLILESNGGRWNPEAWRSLIWTATEKGDGDLFAALAGQLLAMPDPTLVSLLDSATSWLRQRREALLAADLPGGPQFWLLWDRLADLTYRADAADPNDQSEGNLEMSSLNDAGGVLAWALLDALGASAPAAAAGLGADFDARFSVAAGSSSHAGLLARVHFSRALAYLNHVSPEWTAVALLPRFSWDHPEALAMWKSYSQGSIGSANLFNTLKPALLAALQQPGLSDQHLENLAAHLLQVVIWHQGAQAAEYDLTNAEFKRVLTTGPNSVRKNISWQLWRLLKANEGSSEERAVRWRTLVGPIFASIWPLDARLRSESLSRNLVHMLLDTGAAFPEAVDAAVDVIVPYQLYRLEHLWLVKPQEIIHREFPKPFLRLASALIDPKDYPIPADLGEVLQQCVEADPTVVNEPAYRRLFALSRLGGA